MCKKVLDTERMKTRRKRLPTKRGMGDTKDGLREKYVKNQRIKTGKCGSKFMKNMDEERKTVEQAKQYENKISETNLG